MEKDNYILDIDFFQEEVDLDFCGSHIITGSGSNDYTQLNNIPAINGVKLIGDKTSEQLKILTKSSELINDAHFVLEKDLPTIIAQIAPDLPAMKELVGDLPSGFASVIEYINSKTENVIQGILIDGKLINRSSKNQVEIPLATQTTYGLIRGSNEDNEISITNKGTLEINSVSVSKLTQKEDEELVFDCNKK